MKSYKLSENGIKKLNYQVAARLGGTFALAFLALVAFSWWREDQNWVVTLSCAGVLLVILILIAVWRGMKTNREMMASVRIEVGEDTIARSQVRASTVTIQRDEITYVAEIPRGLAVHTADKNRVLGIPSALDQADYEEIRQLLSTWSTIRPQSPKDKLLRVGLYVGLLAGFGIIFLSTSIYLVLVTGLILIGFYGYMAWRIWQTEGVDAKFRQQFTIMAVLMGILFAIKVITFFV